MYERRYQQGGQVAGNYFDRYDTPQPRPASPAPQPQAQTPQSALPRQRAPLPSQPTSKPLAPPTPSEYEAPLNLPQGGNYFDKYGPAKRLSLAEQAAYPFQGFNVGLADALGAPVDIVAATMPTGEATYLPFQGGRFNPLEKAAVDIGLIKPTALPPAPTEPIGGSQYLRGKLADIGAGYRSIEDVPPELRPITKAFEVGGGAAPFIAAPLVAARAGIQAAGALRPIIETARTAPTAFTASELAATGGAGAGRWLSETIFPGNEVAGLTSELIGGVYSPTRILSNLARLGGSGISKLRGMVSKSAQERNIAISLAEQMQQAGEDVPSIISRLEQPAQFPAPTPGIRADSPFLLSLERKLIAETPELDNRVAQQLRLMSEEFERLQRQAIAGGDPAVVREAARERMRWLEGLLSARVAEATQRATQTAGAIRPGMEIGAAGKEARNTLWRVEGDAREGEKALWQGLDQGIDIPTPEGFLEADQTVTNELLKGEYLPEPIEAFRAQVRRSVQLQQEAQQARVQGAPNAAELAQAANAAKITSGELMRFRSRALAIERSMRASSDTAQRSLAHHVRDLATGTLDDLAIVPGSDDARAFSRRLNDLFTKNIVGDLLGHRPSGGFLVEPELTLQQALGSGGPKAAVTSRQIEEAAQAKGLPGVGAQTTLPAQEQHLRNIIRGMVDPYTGAVNPGSLAAWRRDNQELLQQFPGLNQAISDAASAQKLLKEAEIVQRETLQKTMQERAFAQVAQVDDPVYAIGRILEGTNPVTQYTDLVRSSIAAGTNAVAGLRAATFDWIFKHALAGGSLGGREIKQILNRAPAGMPSLAQIMRGSGVISGPQWRSLNMVLDEAERIQSLMETSYRLDPDAILEPIGQVGDLVTRLVGANIGGAGAVGSSVGAPLVAAQAGSKFARDLVSRLPLESLNKVLLKAVDNPAYLARLLKLGQESARSPKAQQDLASEIYKVLLGGSEAIIAGGVVRYGQEQRRRQQ